MQNLISIAAVVVYFALLPFCLNYGYFQGCIRTKVVWILKVYVGPDPDIEEGILDGQKFSHDIMKLSNAM